MRIINLSKEDKEALKVIDENLTRLPLKLRDLGRWDDRKLNLNNPPDGVVIPEMKWDFKA